jgi:hypothetical protein
MKYSQRRITRFAALVVLMVVVAAPAAARGVSPATLGNAGWFCFPVPGLGVHCVKDAEGLFSGESDAVSVMIFEGTDPASRNAEFLGTELLIHDHLFAGQPCPQDGGAYFDLSGEGLPYFACHHYDTGG